MRHIGLVYTKGAMPFLEEFGHLPTDLVRGDGTVGGKRASQVLEMLIIPGGSLVESGIKPELAREIESMGEDGRPVLGVCSGFELLSRRVDIGRLSREPIYKDGLGLLDVEFRPLVCTEWVEARATGRSFLTEGVAKAQGFHAHTYGRLEGKAKAILRSPVTRLDYKPAKGEVVSGVVNKGGNVVGTLVHRLLDENRAVLQSTLDYMGITDKEYGAIKRRNLERVAPLRREVGVDTEVLSRAPRRRALGRGIVIASVGTGSGKTVVTAGMAGALKRSGYAVNSCKIGSDVRDLMPSLYLTKEPMRRYSSIRIGGIGWSTLGTLRDGMRGHDITIIEGAMGLFTGFLREGVERPFSAVEVASSLSLPLVMVINCEKGGIEGAAAEYLGYRRLAEALGVRMAGIILNKAKLERDDLKIFRGVEVLGVIPRLAMGDRGTIPEVELRLEEFSEKALAIASEHLDVRRLAALARVPAMRELDYKGMRERFVGALGSSGTA